MESNRDEAERCIEIAAQAFKEYKTQRAKNFLRKAENLYPTQQAKDLLAKVKEFDREQQVYRIQRCRNHYEVLEVSRDATDNDVKVAYKKLVLLVHPDKNKTLGAKEAFVRVEEAKNILSNSTQRNSYNLTMKDDTVYETCEGDDPPEFKEEVYDDKTDGENDYSIPKCRMWWETRNGQFYLAVFPVILLILIPALYLGLTTGVTLVNRPSQIYSLTPNKKFSVRRRTIAAKISYYVTVNYLAELLDVYQGSLAKLEKEVKLAFACEEEKAHKKSEIEAALNSPHRNSPFWDDWYDRVRSMETTSCSNLEMLINNRSKIINFRIF